MTLKEVIAKFLNRKAASNSTGSLFSNGNCLYSYSTCIAEWSKNGILVLNTTKYSVTTSKHQSFLKRAVSTPYSVDSIPRNSAHILRETERIYG